MARRECYSCGSRPCDTAFPAERIKGLPLVCLECAVEWASEVTREARCYDTRIEIMGRRRIMTRASYRARLRVRKASAQGDLVDAIQARP
jgi:hypothetical protein